MRFFPTTCEPVWGQSQTWEDIGRWYTRLTFSHLKTTEQEVVPEFDELKATLTVRGAPGEYLVDFPGGRTTLTLGSGAGLCESTEQGRGAGTVEGRFDASALVCKGKHLYRLRGPGEAHFEAELRVELARPLVRVGDEAFIVDWRTLGEGERQQMTGNRGAHRVGRWPAWVTVHPADFHGTEVTESIDLDGAWRFHGPIPDFSADLSGLNVDDSDAGGFREVRLPHAWDEALSSADGYAWYRYTVDVPEGWGCFGEDDPKGGAPKRDDPAGGSASIALRFQGVDDEALVFVNGHEVGFYEGRVKPYQFDVTRQIRPGQPNVIAVRVQKHGDLGGGLVGAVSLARVVRYGVAFSNRLYPAGEEALRVDFFAVRKGEVAPLGFGRSTKLAYGPPTIALKDMESAHGDRVSLRTAVDPVENRVLYEVRARERTTCLVRLRFASAQAASGAKRTPVPAELWATADGEGRWLIRAIPDGEAGSASPAEMTVQAPGATAWLATGSWNPADHRALSREPQEFRGESIELVIAFATGGADEPFVFTVGRLTGPSEGRSEGRDASGSQSAQPSLQEAVDRWEEEVYQVARPIRMNPLEAAAFRVYKQTVTLDARYVSDDAYHGLLADFDKPVFVVYWMRDCCLSVPGAVYTGGEARLAALANVGETLDRYAEFPEVTGIYPDGELRGGTFSDGGALGVVAQSYAWALEGDEWLTAHYPAARAFIEYLMRLDQEDGDPLDGMIRCSRGDWKDVGSMDTIRRAGAVLYMNVCYLRALRLAAEMADAVGDSERASAWRALREKGIETLNRPVADGGLWLPDHGYYAEWVQCLDRTGWVYPRDLDQVTVFSAFASVAHGMALVEGVVPQERVASIVARIRAFGLTDPLPAPAQFPFYDIMAELGSPVLPESHPRSNPWLLAKRFAKGRDGITPEMRLPWKGWPGNHVWGGRWPLAAGWLMLGLWREDPSLAAKARRALERSLLRVRHPGKCVEVESYSAVTREETGAHIDPAGYYQLWSGAVPLQAIVEGAYGARPTPGGAYIDARGCPAGDGLGRLPIRGGELSYVRASEGVVEVYVNARAGGTLDVVLPWPNAAVEGVPQTSVRIGRAAHNGIGGEGPAPAGEGAHVRIDYTGNERIRIVRREP